MLSPNVAVVKAGYDAFAIGDMEAWAAVQLISAEVDSLKHLT